VAFEGEVGGAVVGHDLLGEGHGGERIFDFRFLIFDWAGVEEGEIVVGEGEDLPEGLAAGEVEGGEGVGLGEALEDVAREGGSAVELGDGGEGAILVAGGDELVGVGELQAFDLAEAEAERGGILAPGGFVRHRGGK